MSNCIESILHGDLPFPILPAYHFAPISFPSPVYSLARISSEDLPLCPSTGYLLSITSVPKRHCSGRYHFICTRNGEYENKLALSAASDLLKEVVSLKGGLNAFATPPPHGKVPIQVDCYPWDHDLEPSCGRRMDLVKRSRREETYTALGIPP
jgi:hypothetical protein